MPDVFIRQPSMHRLGMILWLWTWAAWERVKYGSTVRASDDIGLHIQEMATVAHVTMLELIPKQNAENIVELPHRDGKKFRHTTSQHLGICICDLILKC